MLSFRKKIERAKKHSIYAIFALAVLLKALDTLESYAAMYESMRYWRIAFSVLGYWLRPLLLLFLVFVTDTSLSRKWYLYIPEAVNVLIMGTAFFSPVAFYFNDNYIFRRGILGYTPFVVSFLYLVYFLIVVVKTFRTSRRRNAIVLAVFTTGCVSAVLIDVFAGGSLTYEAITITAIFYFIFIDSHYSGMDTLTTVLNRELFYEDCKVWESRIVGAVAMDMNELKEINDTYGHDAGDKALSDIGAVLKKYVTHGVSAYRMGGDEFTLLLYNGNGEKYSEYVERIKSDVSAIGLSISVGGAIRKRGETLAELIKRADSAMYDDKALYYSNSGHDRRARSAAR